MLNLSCGITFGMDVGNLLQLERTFECRRECVAATEEAEVLRLCIFCRDFFDRFVLFK